MGCQRNEAFEQQVSIRKTTVTEVEGVTTIYWLESQYFLVCNEV
jgi:hypothetical protein